MDASIYAKSPYRPPFIGRAQEESIAVAIPFPSRELQPVEDHPRAA